MTILLTWRFWVATATMGGTLSAIGFAAARLLVPEPPHYFRALHFELALPPGWRSDREGDEFVCMPPGEGPKEAIMIIASKVRSSDDHLEDYLKVIGQPRTTVLPDGSTMISEVLHYRRQMIGDHEWVDALHKNSEIRNYHTRYLGTVTSQLGCLVTFSAYSERYAKHNRMFEKSIRSLRVYQRKSAFN